MSMQKRPSSFTQIIKPLLYVMTIPGFRPFAMPDEWGTVKKFSIVGVLFWIPVPLLTGYVLGNCIKSLIEFSKLFGIFDGRTIYYVTIILCDFFQFLYVLIAPVYASKIYTCLERLDTVSLNAKNRGRFLKLFYITFSCFVLFLIAVCATLLASSLNLLQQSGAVIPIWTYVAICEMTSAMISFILPLLLLIFTAYYIGLAFDENIEKLRACPEHQLDEQLPELYYSYLNLAKTTRILDDFFCLIVLSAIAINGVTLCIFLLNINIFVTLPINMVAAMMIIVLGTFAGYNFICSWLNDKSREIRNYLHEIGPANQNIHQWLDCFQRKVTDNTWGLTIGNFILLERTAVLTICGALLTFIAFYAQFNTDPSKSDFKQFNVTQLLQNTN